MKTCLSVLLLLAVAAAQSAAQSNAAPARLAIIVEDPGAAAVGDMLTVELSKRAGLQLLERAEIDRVYREQALSAGNRDYLKLGQVLGADGLLVLAPGRDEFKRGLEVHLIAVRPGVLLAGESFTWPSDNSAPANLGDWAAGLAKQLDPLVPKLRVLPRDAIPISVVNLRSAIQSSESRDLERQLTLLTIERLTRERQLFVLERRSMQMLTAEKELKGMDDSAFWSGSYLLEGTLDREGYSREQLTLSVRLAPSRGGAPLSIEVSGSRTNLPAVADQLARRILTSLKLRPGDEPWNPAEEADRYFEQAQWTYRWSLFSEAASACEASWALGKQTKEAAALRIRAYYEDSIDTAIGWYDVTRKLVTFGPGVRFVPGKFIRPVEPGPGSGVPPDGERFARVRHAMELYCQDFRRFIAADPNPGWQWHDLGIDLLEGASCWLRHYYYMPDSRTGQEDTIADVQVLAKEMANLIGGLSAYTNDFVQRPFFTSKVNWGFESPVQVMRTAGVLLDTKVNWGAYWAATPEEGVALYRSLVTGGSMPKVRRFFLNPDFLDLAIIYDPNNPRTAILGGSLPTPAVLSYLCGWKGQDRQRALKVWHAFIDELCDSTNLAIRVEGLFLQCAQSPTDEQRDRSFRELMSFLQQHGDAITEAGLDSNLVGDVQAVLEPKGTLDVQPEAVEARRQIWKQWAQTRADSAGQHARAAKLEEMKDYLATGAYNFGKFNALFFQFDYQADDARQLLPALNHYRSNLTFQSEALAHALAQLQANRGTRSPDESAKWAELSRQRGQLSSSGRTVNRLEQLLQNKLQPTPDASTPLPAAPPSATSSNPATVRAATSSPSAGGRRPAIRPEIRPGLDLASLGFTNPLQVIRFWPLPDRLPEANERSDLSVTSCSFREGRLWVDARAAHLGSLAGDQTYLNCAAIFSVDLDSFQSQAIPLDPRTFTLLSSPLNSSMPSFDVQDSWLYVNSADVVRRYSANNRAWQDLPVPLQGHARITFIGDRMFVSTADSILEAAPDGTRVRILASSRRHPAVTKLDAVPGYGFAPIIAGPDDSVITFVAGNFYELARNATDWTVLPRATEPGASETRCAVFDGSLLLTCRPFGKDEQVIALWRGSRTPELLLVRPPRNFSGSPTVSGRPGAPRDSSVRPRWEMPGNLRTLDQTLGLDRDSLWVLVGGLDSPPRAGAQGMSPTPSARDALLLRFRRNGRQPSIIPLQFKLPESPGRAGVMPRSFLLLVPTPKGMVIANTGVAGIGVGVRGFWFIPQSELDGPGKAVSPDSAREEDSRDKR